MVRCFFWTFLLLIFVQCNRHTTYYIDPSGDDKNSGKNTGKPWKTLEQVNKTLFLPGDQILFRQGGSWNGQLHPKGSGVKGRPILIGMYGKGPRPSINGNGISGSKAGAVFLFNQDHWKIENLDISNKPDSSKPGKRYGILVRWHDYGTGENVHINNCAIHDVSGSMEGRFNGDAILVVATGSEKPTNYNDILIENCLIKNIDRTGISIWSQWHIRNGMNFGKDSTDPEAYHNSNGPWKPSTNVIIRNNSLENTGGDGMIVSCTDGALMEYNVICRANQRGTSANAGMWPHNSDHAVMQYNEVYDTRYSGDGQGFDIDQLCNHTISQYNYSHDNRGGFHLICSPPGKDGRSTGNVIRYNISQNDGNTVFVFAGGVDSTWIYNNTVYIGKDMMTNLYGVWDYAGGVAVNTFLFNNIFYNLGKGKYIFAPGSTVQFDNNCYYGNHPDNEPTDYNKVTGNPLLIGPGSGAAGRNSADGYGLSPGSPCLSRGRVIPANGGQDFWGNPVSESSPPNIGAYAGNQPVIQKEKEQSAALYLKLLQSDFSEFNIQLKKENKRRMDAIKNKKPVYGPVLYSEEMYYAYLHNNMEIQLKEFLGKEVFTFTDREFTDYYNSNKDHLFRNYIMSGSLLSPGNEYSGYKKMDEVKEQIRQSLIDDKYEALVRSQGRIIHATLKAEVAYD